LAFTSTLLDLLAIIGAKKTRKMSTNSVPFERADRAFQSFCVAKRAAQSLT
jgi:hypothetical protein